MRSVHALATAGADEGIDLVELGDQPYAEFGIRLISKMYQADPLVCRTCAGPLQIVAYINDELSITRVLDHLGLSPPPQEKPPPTRELVRVPVDDEERELQAG